MKRKNSATAALIASRWKKISRKRRKKRNRACRLPKQSNQSPCLPRRLLRPSPHHPLRAVGAAAVSPKLRRKPPRNQPPRRKRPRRKPSPPRRKRRRNQRRKKLLKNRRRRRRRKAAANYDLGPTFP